MTEQPVWQPVEDGQWEQDGCDLDVDAGGTQLHMYHDTGLDLVTILPDDLRLCRRAASPAAQPDELERLRDEVARLRDALMQSEMDHLIRDTYGVPAPQAQGVPVEVRETWDLVLTLAYPNITNRFEGAELREVLTRVEHMRDWLDSQRQQEDSDE